MENKITILKILAICASFTTGLIAAQQDHGPLELATLPDDLMMPVPPVTGELNWPMVVILEP